MTREEYDRKIEDKKYSLQQQKDRFVAYYHIGKSYIKSLEATIETQELIIKDKTAIIEAMAQPKTCYSCEFSTFYPYDKREGRWKTCTCAWSPALDNRVTPSQWCYAYSKEAQ